MSEKSRYISPDRLPLEEAMDLWRAAWTQDIAGVCLALRSAPESEELRAKPAQEQEESNA